MKNIDSLSEKTETSLRQHFPTIFWWSLQKTLASLRIYLFHLPLPTELYRWTFSSFRASEGCGTLRPGLSTVCHEVCMAQNIHNNWGFTCAGQSCLYTVTKTCICSWIWVICSRFLRAWNAAPFLCILLAALNLTGFIRRTWGMRTSRTTG